MRIQWAPAREETIRCPRCGDELGSFTWRPLPITSRGESVELGPPDAIFLRPEFREHKDDRGTIYQEPPRRKRARLRGFASASRRHLGPGERQFFAADGVVIDANRDARVLLVWRRLVLRVRCPRCRQEVRLELVRGGDYVVA